MIIYQVGPFIETALLEGIMQRLRAKIIETKEIGKKTTEQGFTSTETLCKVKIGDAVHKSLKFPDGTKDREHWVLRDAIFPWELNK